MQSNTKVGIKSYYLNCFTFFEFITLLSIFASFVQHSLIVGFENILLNIKWQSKLLKGQDTYTCLILRDSFVLLQHDIYMAD